MSTFVYGPPPPVGGKVYECLRMSTNVYGGAERHKMAFATTARRDCAAKVDLAVPKWTLCCITIAFAVSKIEHAV